MYMLPHFVESHCVETNLSCNKLRGYFEPGGKRGGGPLSASTAVSLEDLDEFPALPDFTIPFLGGINTRRDVDGLVSTSPSCHVPG